MPVAAKPGESPRCFHLIDEVKPALTGTWAGFSMNSVPMMFEA